MEVGQREGGEGKGERQRDRLPWDSRGTIERYCKRVQVAYIIARTKPKRDA